MLCVDVDGIKKLIAEMRLLNFIHLLVEYIREDLANWSDFTKKSRISFYLPEGILELMPIASRDFFANKLVCTHPNNFKLRKYGVMGLGLWIDTHSGEPLMLAEMTFLTALRTAAVSVLASLAMGPVHAHKLAIIGCGSQSHFQVLAHHIFFKLTEVNCFDIKKSAMQSLINEMASFGIKVNACSSVYHAAKNADIITTATNSLRLHPVLEASILHPQLHINAIGGDAPGYSELDPNILQQVDRIGVEYLPQTLHEGEIQQLPFNLIQSKTYELWQMVSGLVKGRGSDDEITLFDSVGFALFDYSALRLIYNLTSKYDFCYNLPIIPSFDNSKSLFQQLVDIKK